MARSRSFIPSFLRGLSVYFQVPGTLVRHGLWPLQFLPAVISLLLAIVLFAGSWFAAGAFSSWIDGLVSLSIEWLDRTVTVTLAILSFLVLMAGFFFLHKHLALIVLAPFLGTIAEKTLQAAKGDNYTKSDLGTAGTIRRSISINLRYIVREVLANFGFLLCGLIPGIGSLLSAVGMFLTQAKFLGFGLMDFPLENRGLSVNESDAFARERTGLSAGLGAGYLLLMMIPFVGWTFAPTFGTVAGTLLAMRELEKTEGGT